MCVCVCVCADIKFIADSLVALGQNATFMCMLNQSLEIHWEINNSITIKSPNEFTSPIALGMDDLDSFFIDVTENGSRITIEGTHANNLTTVQCFHFEGLFPVNDGKSELRIFGNACITLLI